MGTALITGASSGIGAAFARAYAQRQVNLVLVARDQERLQNLATELSTRHGLIVEVLPADLSRRDDTLRVAHRLAEQQRPVDVLVNNAGFGFHSGLAGPDLDELERGLDVMCRAVLILGNAAARAMRERGRGRIINVSSLAGWLSMGAYSAAKAWTTAYSEGLAGELRGTGVTVTALCPGWVRTEFHERAGIRATSIPGPLWLDADRLVRVAIAHSARGKVISTPSTRYALAGVVLRKLPRVLVRRMSVAFDAARHRQRTPITTR